VLVVLMVLMVVVGLMVLMVVLLDRIGHRLYAPNNPRRQTTVPTTDRLLREPAESKNDRLKEIVRIFEHKSHQAFEQQQNEDSGDHNIRARKSTDIRRLKFSKDTTTTTADGYHKEFHRS
jgi:hypothetical protein